MKSAFAHVENGRTCASFGSIDAGQILRKYSTPAQKRGTDPGTALISSSIMLGYDGLVEGLGGNSAILMRSAGLDPSLAANPFEQIDFAAYAILLEHTAQMLDCPDFGMRLGRLQSGLVVMGPAGLALERVDTIGDMFKYCSQLMHIYSTGIQINLNRDFCSGESLLTFELLASRTPLRRQIMEQILLIGNNSAIDLSGGRARAKEIWFTHAPLAPPSAYKEAFGAKVVFSESFDAAIFNTADIDAVVRTSDREMFQNMLDSLSPYLAGRASVSAQVKREIARWIHEDSGCERERVSRRLGLHPRTLQRRLNDEGLTFEMIKDQVRRELAQHYLFESTVPLTDVAARLGFAEPAVLTRACRRWFSRTPREMRRAGR